MIFFLLKNLLCIFSRYLEPDVDSNLSEISAYNMNQDYTYDDIPNDISLSTAGKIFFSLSNITDNFEIHSVDSAC